jgi:hypothetical protein
MKSLREYIAESEEWMESPAAGDAFAFELPDETICETYIIEVADDCILLDSTAEINAALAEWAALEDTDEGDSGVVLETMGYGTLVGEGQMKRAMHDAAERMSLAQFKDRYGDEDWIEDFWRAINDEPEVVKDVDEDQDSAVVAGKEAAIDAAQILATDEAKYQGREVKLNKPMKGDVKKSKVYVRDPATGNIKKVNFGHGGKTAKRLGQKTMKIKKSDPARRKSFRARHNCANPGPKTKARYWSCRAW